MTCMYVPTANAEALIETHKYHRVSDTEHEPWFPMWDVWGGGYQSQVVFRIEVKGVS